MKQIIFILCLLLSFTNCSQNEDTEPREKSITGTWQLIETFGSDGGSQPQWRPLEDGFTYTFRNDGTFTSNRFNDWCTKGNYTVKGDILAIKYDCEDIEDESTLESKLTFENEFVILTPTYLTCIEGCGYKFQKIDPVE